MKKPREVNTGDESSKLGTESGRLPLTIKSGSERGSRGRVQHAPSQMVHVRGVSSLGSRGLVLPGASVILPDAAGPASLEDSGASAEQQREDAATGSVVADSRSDGGQGLGQRNRRVRSPHRLTSSVQLADDGPTPAKDVASVPDNLLTTTFGRRVKEAKDAASEHPWDSDSKSVIDGMVVAMRDTLTPVHADDLDTGQRGSPVPLEQYLLSRIQRIPDISRQRPDGGFDAAHSITCIRDEVRTRKFLQGIGEAVVQLDSSETDIIEVCEAGCGALPILSIYAALSSDKVRVTALEFNPDSVRVAREVVSGLGLQDRITVVQADATSYEPQAPLDLLISETMDSGLAHEPIVQILAHLQPHVKPDGITLPDGIQVKAALVPLTAFTNNATVLIADTRYSVVTPDWRDVVRYQPGDDLPVIQFALPVEKGLYYLAVTTEVSIGSQRLGLFESRISSPHYLRDAQGNNLTFFFEEGNRDKSIVVRYTPGDNLNNKAIGLTRRNPAQHSNM